jgi:hypothetical protein
MFNYTSDSTERTPLLPRHEQFPSYSAAEASQLNELESRNMPSNTSASIGDNPTLPSSCEKLSPYAPHSESPTLQLPADNATARRVRKFLHLLLTTKREIPATEADEIVAQCADISNGYQLRTYSKPQFELIFGPDVGRVLWDDVDSCLENNQMRAQRWAVNVRLMVIGWWYPYCWFFVSSPNAVDLYANRFPIGAACMAAFIVVLISLMLFWLWNISRIGAFAVGFFDCCTSIASVLLVAWCYREFNSHGKMCEREMQQLSKAEARRDRFADDSFRL